MENQAKDKNFILHPFTSFHKDQYNLVIHKAEKEFLYTPDGKVIIDAIASWWVNLHGHSHPYIANRIYQQATMLEHVMFSGFTHEPAIQLAEKLLGYVQPYHNKIFFSDNGSTSVEVAIKMALQYWSNKGTPRKKIMAFRNAYHGDTFGAMAVSERDVFTQPFQSLLFEVNYIDLPTEDNLDEVMTKAEKYMETGEVAAFIFEPLVQGAGGMRMHLPEHLDFLIRLCRDYDVLTIADEVMTGFGRTGKMFACDHLQLKPDFMCMSKGITGGFLPLGVTTFTSDIASAFEEETPDKTFYHGHSYTANPLACAAALASLELFEKEQTFEKINRIKNFHLDFADELDLMDGAEQVRTCGTILAFDVKTTDTGYFYTNPIKNVLYHFYLEKGVLLRPLGNVVYCIPPYCISDESLQTMYSAMKESLIWLTQTYKGE